MIDNQNMPVNGPERFLAPGSEFEPDMINRRDTVIAAAAKVALSGAEA